MALVVRRFPGLMPYQGVLDAMHRFTEQRTASTDDEFWLLQHEPVFTQGQAGKPEHVLFAGDIPVVQTDRGGQVTYHGPGQWVLYPLVDINRLGIGPRELVTRIEQAIVALLAEYHIEAQPRSDAPGVYVHGAKIASLGLRIRKGFSFHGLALNTQMDLEPFRRINPCGYADMQMTQIAELTVAINPDVVGQKLIAHLAAKLGYDQWQESGACLP
ncbi:MAG: lipoyl(octanoyl) transferase LipB [Oceanospirillaceae bacterium]|nr:lipoyl(octanoyl) transferase LipB [Oceanospirillaceae bacterium]MCP5334516.1 lipoyl(octanoyl) transferase LipB [Oceanospirillaceae bacterium]MCP5350779.1 lipoyl(octanoyl) transferase LipB [Oceanospirillaceae bacterium]